MSCSIVSKELGPDDSALPFHSSGEDSFSDLQPEDFDVDVDFDSTGENNFEFQINPDIFSPKFQDSDNKVAVKRKRIRKPYVPKKKLLFAPRVLRSDLRRQYMYMLINATNSGDHVHYGNFFRIFGNDSPRLHAAIAPPAALKATSNDVMVEGPDELACFLATSFHSSPDLYFRIDNVELHTVGGSMQCRIECDYVMGGTSIFSKWIDEIVEEVHDALTDLHFEPSNAPSCEAEQYTEVIALAATRLQQPLPSQPDNTIVCKFELKGRFRMFIDEQKRIYLLEMYGQ